MIDFFQGFLERQKAEDEKITRMVGEAFWNFQCIGMPGTFCPAWCRGCFSKKFWRTWWDTTPAGKAHAEASRDAAIQRKGATAPGWNDPNRPCARWRRLV